MSGASGVRGDVLDLLALVEDASDLIQSVDPEGRYRYVNRSWLRTLGYRRDEVGDLSVVDVIDPGSLEHCLGELRRVLAGSVVRDLEAVFRGKDGRRIEVRGSAHARFQDGRPVETFGIFRDVTEERRSKRERDRFFDLSLELLCVASFEGFFVSVNPAFTEVLGWSVEELRERPFLDFVHPDDREATLAELGSLGAGQPTLRFDNRYRCRDGTYRWFSWVATPAPDEGRIYAVARDVTDRRNAADAVRASEGRLRAIFDHAGEGILTVDPRGRVESANPFAARLWRVDADGLVGRPAADLLPDRTPVGSGTGPARSVRGRRPDGTEFPAEVSESSMDLPDGARTLLLVRDVSEREALDRMKREFVSTVSHELRTPMTSIRGSLGILRSGLGGQLSERGVEMTDIAIRNTDRLIRLVSDILDVEKLATGRMDLEPRIVDLRELVRQAAEAGEPFAAEFGVKLVVEPFDEPAWIEVDPDRWLQVLDNLLSNAAKFSPAGARVDVEIEPRDDRVAVTVRDRGVGIPEAMRARIFERFGQVDATDSRRRGGSGLGLHIVRGIVERSGGTIELVSEPGAGSAFTVSVPRSDPPPSIARAPSDPGRPDAGRRVLVCEDDADVARLLAVFLERDGWVPVVARTAAEALEEIRRGPLAAMTLDLDLPDEHGLTLLRGIRAEASSADLPVVVVSASVDGRDGLNGDAVGIVDWLRKPIDEERLLAAVRSVDGTDRVPHVLHLEDDPDLRQVVDSHLDGIAVVRAVATVADARALLEREPVDLALIDVALPDGSGLDLIGELRRIDPALPIVLFSASEVGSDVVGRVEAALVKSRSSTEDLVTTIRELLA